MSLIGTKPETIIDDGKLKLVAVRRLDLSVKSQWWLESTRGYTHGNVMISPSDGTTAVLTVRVSDDDKLSCVASHPTATTLSPVATEGIAVTHAGLDLHHAFFGFEITTAYGSASYADVWICLKNLRP